MSDIKIGDVVAWADVPDGALVRRAREEGGVFFYQRKGDRGWCVGGRTTDGDGYFEQMDADGWSRPWAHNDRGRVTVVALGLTSQETADDLRRLAEVFEVREALGTMRAANHATERALEDAIKGAAAGPTMGDLFAAMTTVAERLHAAGWRPGMTADDAAHLLAEAGP